MSSLKQKMASRANGARSSGPVTEEGKRRSSQNAIRHGLLARCVVLETESREGFDALSDGFLARFNPADSVEVGFVEEMVAALWRQRRAWAIETKLMDEAIAAQDPEAGGQRSQIARAYKTLAADAHLGLLNRYESRLHRVFQRALHNLLLVRTNLPPSPEDNQCQTNPATDNPPTNNDIPPAKSGTGSSVPSEASGRGACPKISPHRGTSPLDEYAGLLRIGDRGRSTG